MTGIDPQIEKFARYIAATPEVQEKLSQTELDHAKRFVSLFPFCAVLSWANENVAGLVLQVL